MNEADLVRSLTAGRWLSCATLAVGAVAAGPQGLSVLGRPVGAGARVSLDGDRLSVVRDGWRLDAFVRYRPLVYYAAFGADAVFDCLRIAVQSLFEFGRYDGEVLVLTDAAHLSWPDCLPADLRGHVRTRAAQGADMLDWTLARYGIAATEGLAHHRPFLYLDADMACDGPIDPLLRRLAISPLLHAVGENAVTRAEDWYGASLLAADGVAVAADRPGFSTGALGFATLPTARTMFDLVPRLARGHATGSGTRDAFDCYDQPFANYAAIKLGGVETTLLGRYLDNRYYWLDRAPARRGLAHFTGGTRAAGAKQAAMGAYVEALRAVNPPARDATGPA